MCMITLFFLAFVKKNDIIKVIIHTSQQLCERLLQQGGEPMLLTYQECLDKYGSDYQLKKEIGSGTLFMKEKGIYSTQRNTSEIDVIMRKYSKTVCTGRSAFY